MANVKKLQTSLMIGLLIMPLSACISLLPKPGKPPLIAQFRMVKDISILPSSETSVIIDIPQMSRSYNRNDIAIIGDNGELSYIDGVILPEKAPYAIQNLIMEAFDKSQAFKLVARSNTSIRTDYFIAFDVTRFDVTMPKKKKDGVATFEIVARLINFPTRKPIASKVFLVVQNAKRGSALEPAIALQAATQNAAIDIVNWSNFEIRKYQSSIATSANK